jgi:hypothetical protein
LVIIATIEPEKLGISCKFKYKYKEYFVYQYNQNDYYVHLTNTINIKIWLDSVRNFIDQDENRFLFIGKGREAGENKHAGCIVTGHVNLSGINPLIGPNADQYGPRFFDVGDLYSVEMRNNLFKENDDFTRGNILIPASMEELSELEKKVLNLENIKISGLTKDIFGGAIAAKQAKAKSAGLLLFQDEYDLPKIVNI